MQPAKLKIKIYKGSTWPLGLTWRSPAPEGETLGPPISLSGFTAKMQIRDRAGGNVLLELSTENERIKLEQSVDAHGNRIGRIDLLIEANATDDITNSTGVYDLKLYNADTPAVEYPLLYGSVVFTKGITTEE